MDGAVLQRELIAVLVLEGRQVRGFEMVVAPEDEDAIPGVAPPGGIGRKP
jgi:hypothetical protein